MSEEGDAEITATRYVSARSSHATQSYAERPGAAAEAAVREDFEESTPLEVDAEE
ncbi:MAG: hypothetical protein ACTH1Z_08295 [Ancrocorticia sp.]|uniref:hypothetical protein n=1 Tax=Ancrocorticia sp. TaxID=2593684 RepID=UPI003F8F98E4